MASLPMKNIEFKSFSHHPESGENHNSLNNVNEVSKYKEAPEKQEICYLFADGDLRWLFVSQRFIFNFSSCANNVCSQTIFLVSVV